MNSLRSRVITWFVGFRARYPKHDTCEAAIVPELKFRRERPVRPVQGTRLVLISSFPSTTFDDERFRAGRTACVMQVGIVPNHQRAAATGKSAARKLYLLERTAVYCVIYGVTRTFIISAYLLTHAGSRGPGETRGGPSKISRKTCLFQIFPRPGFGPGLHRIT